MKPRNMIILALSSLMMGCLPNAEITTTKDLDKAARLNVALGLNYMKEGQISRAKSKFMHAKKLAPMLPIVHYSYGIFLEHVGEKKDAEKAYLEAINLNKKGGSEHHMYGAFLCRQKEFRKAENEFIKALADPNYMHIGETLENAGLCVLQIPDKKKAAEYFEKAQRYGAATRSVLKSSLDPLEADKF